MLRRTSYFLSFNDLSYLEVHFGLSPKSPST